MLNVTHFDWTVNNIRYGRKVSRLVGGKPFVVSTSYNGRGPVHYLAGPRGHRRRINVFCNVRYRGLGPQPTTATGLDQGVVAVPLQDDELGAPAARNPLRLPQAHLPLSSRGAHQRPLQHRRA